jgi:hypothetical protein
MTIYVNMVTAGADNTGATDCSALLQSKISSCPAGQVIYFPAGTYRINASNLPILRSEITIRGAGMGITRLKHYGGGDGVFVVGTTDYPIPPANIAITGGATNGSKVLTVASTANVTIGKMVRVEQPDLSYMKQIYNTPNNLRSTFRVVAKTANTVTLNRPLNFTFSNSPKMAVHNQITTRVGFEDLTFDLSSSGASNSIFWWQVYGGWMKGVEVNGTSRRQVTFWGSIDCEIRQCYMHDTRGPSGPNHEGIDLYANCHRFLIEDNICVRAGFPMIVIGDYANGAGGCTGNVVAYNYCVRVDTGAVEGPCQPLAGADISVNHAPHNVMNLFEGNVAGGFNSDGYYGSASHNTLLRNWFSAQPYSINPGKPCGNVTVTRNLMAINLCRWSTYFNVVGNILGYSGFPANGVYESEAILGYSAQWIYRLGYPNMGNHGHGPVYGPTNPPDYTNIDPQGLDRNVKNTLIRHGNYDYSTKSQKWEPGIADRTIPNSYYLAGKPSWFGNLTWPPIDPANPSSSAPTSIPASNRYLKAALPVRNISTRGFVQNADRVLIGGFIVSGTGQKEVVLRALGPSLPLSPALSDPVIELYKAGGGLIAKSDNWRSSQQAPIVATGLAPANDKESALIATLSPGSYTAVVRGANNAAGIGLVEVYDLDNPGSGARLANVSTRGNVLTGHGVLIGGFILGTGEWSTPVVARAMGPTLTQFGVSGVLSDPILELRDGNGALIASNDNWEDRENDEIREAGLALPDARESAIVTRLAPGNYTTIVSGKNGATGIGLVEIFNLR